MAFALLGFLSGLPPRQMDTLYGSPWACLAVLRALPPLGKHYAMRLLYIESGVPVADVDAWIKPEGEAVHRACLAHMRRLRVLVSVDPASNEETSHGNSQTQDEHVRLNSTFRSGLRQMLERSFRVDESAGDCTDDASTDEVQALKVPTRDTLDSFAKGRWEALVLTLTGASDAFDLSSRDAEYDPGKKKKNVAAGLDVAALFRAAKLIGDSSVGEEEGVTEAGFRFLLTTAREQIWLLLTQYITRFIDAARRAGSGGATARDSVEVLDLEDDVDQTPNALADGTENLAPGVIAFLLRLTFQEPGEAYRTDTLPTEQRAVVQDLAHLGLLFPLTNQKTGQGFYVPTYLTAGLSSGSESTADADNGTDNWTENGTGYGVGNDTRGHEGHIVVETNYRVYAYTTSPVEVEILRLFTRPDYRLPNLYVGMVTRESVLAAMSGGIGAEQIVKYLRQHAHPQCRKVQGNPPVPLNVCDQIRLWARERNRVTHADAVLYCDFPTGTGMFEKVSLAAQQRQILLWEDRKNLRLAVAQEGHEDMKHVFAAIRAGET
jgi:transcription initiation factor TFIIH subunit 4